MTNINLAHPALTAFCGAQPGIAMGKELFEFLIRRAINTLNGSASNIKYPSGTPFHNMPVSFSGTVDSTHYSLSFSPVPGQQGQPDIPQVELRHLEVVLIIYLDNVLMSTKTVSYPLILVRLKEQDKKVSIVVDSGSGTWTSEVDQWPPMMNLPNGDPFTPQIKDEWKIQEEAFKLISKDEFGATFVQSVEVPNILGMVDAFSFEGPIRVGMSSELLMFSGNANWQIGCPRRQANSSLGSYGQINDSSGNVVEDSTDLAGSDGGRISVRLPNNTPDSNYPPGLDSGIEHTIDGDVFIHLPRVFLEHRFDGIVKPAVGFGENGDLGPIHWHYEAGIMPAPHSLLLISLVNIWPTEFKISLPLSAFGTAGAGVKIGCIYVEAAGLAFDGTVDPFEAYFKIGLDVPGSDVYFESRLGNVLAHDFQFHHWPEVKFPYDQIGDFVLARVAEHIINQQANAILNTTRFSLADFALFRGFGQLRNNLAGAGDNTSVTMGVSFTRT